MCKAMRYHHHYREITSPQLGDIGTMKRYRRWHFVFFSISAAVCRLSSGYLLASPCMILLVSCEMATAVGSTEAAEGS